MFVDFDKFKYFYSILREVYYIIDLNWEMREDDVDKLVNIIKKHLDKYNSDKSFLKMGVKYQEGIIHVFLSDYVKGRGIKKKFEEKINIKKILRKKVIDKIFEEE